MSNKIVLIIYPFKFRSFDFFRFEIKELEEHYNAKILIHELVDVAFKNFRKVYQNSFFNFRIKSYKSFLDWRKDFRKIVKSNPDLLIIKDIPSSNFFTFLINYEIKKSGARILESASTKHPVYDSKKNFNDILKIFQLNMLINFLKNRIFNFLHNIFYLHPTHCLQCGLKDFKTFYKKNNVKIIEANSLDYSNYVVNIKNIDRFYNYKNKFGIYLDSPTPFFDGDNIITKIDREHFFTVKKWFPSLNNFFDNLEDLLKIKIIIAPHPKVNYKNYSDIYKKRKFLKTKLYRITKFAKLIIGRNSSAFSYCAINTKPALVISSNELISKKKSYEEQLYFAKELGTKVINIDNKFNKDEIHDAIKVNIKALKNYKFNYLTSLKIDKPNYQIIGDNFLK
jgi:hypothetical protein